MGPYCNFCGSRCFVHMPLGIPKEAVKAYGGYKIIATCRAGQKFEKEKTGWCYEDIQNAAIRQQEKGGKR